jgi:drug/metabolite transporter (DMT)-like permease
MTSSRRTDLVLVMVAAVWGSSYLAAKVAAAAAPVVIVLFLRYALSGIACFALVAAQPGALPTRQERRVGSVLGLTQALVLVLETYGVAHTSAANAGLIISLTIVLTPILEAAGRGIRLPVRFFAAASCCLLGVALLVSATGVHMPGGGDLLMLAAAVARAGHVVLLGRLTIGRTVRPLQLTAIQTAVGTVALGAVAVWRLPDITHLTLPTWAVLIYLALGCSVFAFLAQTWAVQRTSASRASLLLGTEPVWAVATGIALGGEHLTVMATIGAVLVVAGASAGQRVERGQRLGRPAASVQKIPTAKDTVVGRPHEWDVSRFHGRPRQVGDPGACRRIEDSTNP